MKNLLKLGKTVFFILNKEAKDDDATIATARARFEYAFPHQHLFVIDCKLDLAGEKFMHLKTVWSFLFISFSIRPSFLRSVVKQNKLRTPFSILFRNS